MTPADGPFRLVCRFELTPEEVRVLAARSAFRAAMESLAPRRRATPLALFAAALASAAVLGWTGVLPPRGADAAILLLVIGYALVRSAAYRGVRRAYRARRAQAESLGRCGVVTAEADPEALTLTAAAPIGVWRYAECGDADLVDGVVTLWGRDGAAAPIPVRALPPGEAERFLAHVRGRIALSGY